jgi:hypothetical protein
LEVAFYATIERSCQVAREGFPMFRFVLASISLAGVLPAQVPAPAVEGAAMPAIETACVSRELCGWTVHVRKSLSDSMPGETTKALEMLKRQLEEIVKVVPARPLAELRKVPLWFTPGYPGTSPRAEYHPGAKWLADHGRDPAMAKGVEFTNIAIFEAEMRRMPNFALHELSHAYHDRVLGFGEERIRAAYAKAKESGRYTRVERRDSEGRSSEGPAYAMTDAMEYFAEGCEAYFSRNDFFPFTREELKRHDPNLFGLLETIWNSDR